MILVVHVCDQCRRQAPLVVPHDWLEGDRITHVTPPSYWKAD